MDIRGNAILICLQNVMKTLKIIHINMTELHCIGEYDVNHLLEQFC